MFRKVFMQVSEIEKSEKFDVSVIFEMLYLRNVVLKMLQMSAIITRKLKKSRTIFHLGLKIITIFLWSLCTSGQSVEILQFENLVIYSAKILLDL